MMYLQRLDLGLTVLRVGSQRNNSDQKNKNLGRCFTVLFKDSKKTVILNRDRSYKVRFATSRVLMSQKQIFVLLSCQNHLVLLKNSKSIVLLLQVIMIHDKH